MGLISILIGFAPIASIVSAIISIISVSIYAFSKIPYCLKSEHSYNYCIKYEVNITANELILKGLLFFIISIIIIYLIIIIKAYIDFNKEKKKSVEDND